MSEPVPTFAPRRRLPSEPSLEELEKQALELMERYGAGDAATVDEARWFGPNPAAFTLGDARRALARAYGYESWAKLKAFVDGVNVPAFVSAIQAGDMPKVRGMLSARPELVSMDLAGNDERRGLHFAVLRRDAAMVRLLMEAGADARKGVWPHRDATSASTLARDREYDDIVSVIEEEERRRREEMSCPNATVSPVQEEVSAAISAGDAATAIRLLEADGSLIQACDRGGATPLHIAAQANDAGLAAWLLERRANVGKEDSRGFTALDRAALAADPRNRNAQRFRAVAKLLLQHGAETTIRAAVALGDAPRVRESLHADPELLRQTAHNGGLLTLAVNHGQLEIVRLLLDLGADPDERILLEELEEPTLSWGMPLWYAALAGNVEIATLLLDRGADPTANVYASGWPLRNAWNHKDGSVKRLLLERGAKPHPYMVAEAHDVAEAARLLNESPGEEVVHELLWSAADHGCPEIVQLALPHVPWPHDDPRWHWVLIQPIRGAGPDSARNEGHFQSMSTLLRSGVSPNVSRLGQTALHFAAGCRGDLSDAGRARFAAMLIDHGANLHQRDTLLQSTPLGWACRWGRKRLAELLVARGASDDEPDAEPWATPAAWARKCHNLT